MMHGLSVGDGVAVGVGDGLDVGDTGCVGAGAGFKDAPDREADGSWTTAVPGFDACGVGEACGLGSGLGSGVGLPVTSVWTS